MSRLAVHAGLLLATTMGRVTNAPPWGLVRCLAQAAGIEAWAELSPRLDYAGHKTRHHPLL